jgi:hypothetical protein
MAHRLVWLWAHSEWPPDDIDHINGNRDDNRFSNLRLASRTQNNANSQVRRDNTSGVKGVYWNRAGRCWQAQIGFQGRVLPLGSFATIEDARNARLAAEQRYFGEFRRSA